MNALLQELVTAQAENAPDARAIVAGNRTWTYGDVEVQSNRLGRALREAGCERGDRVCLLSSKTPEAIMSSARDYEVNERNGKRKSR